MNTRTLARWFAAVFLTLVLTNQAAHAFYDPSLGRWINRDPLGETGGMNLYAFVENGPTEAVDPDGLQAAPLPPITPNLPPFGGNTTASDPKSTGGIMGGNNPPAYPARAPRPCSPIGRTTPRTPAGTKAVECPCSGMATVQCYKFEECVPYLIAPLNGRVTITGNMETKTECPCPEYGGTAS